MPNKQSHSIHTDGALAVRALSKILPLIAPHRSLRAVIADIRRGLTASAAWLVIDEGGTQQIEGDGATAFTLPQARRLIGHPRLRECYGNGKAIAWPRHFGARFYSDTRSPLAMLQTGVICKFHTDNYQTVGYLFLGFASPVASTVMIKRCLAIISEKLKDYLLHLLAQQNAAREMQRIVAQYNVIFEKAPVLMNSFDASNRCILWNGECERLFGWKRDELNQHADPLALFYPDPSVRQQLRESVKHSALTDMREWHPLRRDGAVLTTLWSHIVLPDNTVLNIGLDITARKQAERLLTLKATVDDLTQCYNRAEILRLLAQAAACPEMGDTSVVMLDLDYFKTINDSLGHQVGDAALRHFCDHIRALEHPAMSIGRLGGEEFLLILHGATRHEALFLTEQLRQRLERVPLMVSNTPVRVSFSAGIVELAGRESDVSGLLKEADNALYAAKHAGRGRSLIAAREC